ncbi:hypothetical protein B0H15DRAFT_246586 [Mycena belliarum]|uniref:FAD-binding domain-containing protein n=1 Tax=Mycena belliarum TaxID=1033014 RepID=A0AAD6XT05_9AGAR|nr:hypothetical protein B0H15DRAFT_246586 [Mycena belliae]
MSAPEKPALRFIIVGASIAGLTSAIALKATGHIVLVLEKEPQLGGSQARPSAGARVPLNGCKVLFDWGLEAELRDSAVVGDGLMFHKYGDTNEPPEYIGLSLWHPELLRDARGDFLQMRYRELLRMLYNTAIKPNNTEQIGSSVQVSVLFNTEVVDIDSELCSVTLRSGETHRGDTIIGADGAAGVVRNFLMKEHLGEDSEPAKDIPTGLAVYSAAIPRTVALKHAKLAKLYEHSQSKKVHVFLGNNRGAKISIASGKGPRSIARLIYTG